MTPCLPPERGRSLRCRAMIRPASGPVILIGLLGFWLSLASWVQAEESEASAANGERSALVVTEHLRARLIAERSWTAPGGEIDLLLVFDLKPGWHTYWRNPGDSGEPPRLDWTLPQGVRAGPVQWPYPRLIPVGPLANYGYSGQALHLTRLRVSPDWPPGQSIPVGLKADWLVCAEHCIPESGEFAIRLATRQPASEQPQGRSEDSDARLFARARAELPTAFAASASLDLSTRPLQLRLHREGLPSKLVEIEFFADQWGLIEHAAPQPWRLEGDWVVLDLEPGAALGQAEPSGVVVATGADQLQAFELSRETLAAGFSAEARSPAPLGVPLALLFAFLGGLILNLMPCVFPVLAIKVLGLAEQADLRLGARAWHALMYSSGVLVFFVLIGGLLLLLRAAGAAVGWGFQLQSPVFVTLMADLFLVLGLSLFGALTLGAGLMGVGGAGSWLVGGASSRVAFDRAALAAFGTGGLAALVAAPCTAPLMGAALGYALSLPWFAAMAIILTLGLGMALPFSLLTLFPAWANRLPRPGVWMERLKQALAFPLFATLAWLLWVLVQQTGPAGLGLALSGLLALGFGLWLLEMARQDGHRWRRATQIAVRLLGLASVLLSLMLAWRVGALSQTEVGSSGGAGRIERGSALPAQAYSPQALDSARQQGRAVFVNMTAAWCITCLVNERTALDSEAVAAAFAEQDILYLKGDWTNRNAEITAYLNGFGRDGVPLYVYYPPEAEPVVLPQLLTVATVLGTLKNR